MAALFINGTQTSSKPFSLFVSKKKFINALSSLAASPRRTEKRLFASLTPRSNSIQPFISAKAQCSLGSKSNVRGSKTFLSSTLSSSSAPSGTESSGKLGIAKATFCKASCASRALSKSPTIASFLASTLAFSSVTSFFSRIYSPKSLDILFCSAFDSSSSALAAFSVAKSSFSFSSVSESTPFLTSLPLASSKFFCRYFKSIMSLPIVVEIFMEL